MASIFALLLVLVVITFAFGDLFENPCGKLFMKDAHENCGSKISLPLCKEIISKCCGSNGRCPMTEVLKCCNNGS
uniref:Uncharacterized protein n=1 Tax=Panagrolaimus superbus TaxID=310955 RepID=A0A914YU01_9BILA